MLALLVMPVSGMTYWRIEHALGTEAIIGCDESSQDNYLFAATINNNGELCRGERFTRDVIALEPLLYSPSFYAKPEMYAGHLLTASAQSVQYYPADTFGCPTEPELDWYREEGLTERVKDCVPLLWAQVRDYESVGYFPVPSYAAQYASDQGGIAPRTEVYRVNVGGKELFAITEFIDEHVFEEPPGLREGVAYMPWLGKKLVLTTGGNNKTEALGPQAQMRIFHRINNGVVFQLLSE